MDDWARPSQYKNGTPISKMAQANTKMAQAIFLPGAWGKIPVFMGKNHPTPGAAMTFCMLKTTPPKTELFQAWKNFLKILL